MLVDETVINDDVFFGNFFTGRNEDDTANYQNITVASQVITGVQDHFVTDRFGLIGCYPNPANENTTITFRMNNSNHVSLLLLDHAGALVKTLVDDRREEGEHAVAITLTDLPSGIYLYQLKTGFVNETKKLVIRH
jgi:hypothetical protein